MARVAAQLAYLIGDVVLDTVSKSLAHADAWQRHTVNQNAFTPQVNSSSYPIARVMSGSSTSDMPSSCRKGHTSPTISTVAAYGLHSANGTPMKIL